MNLHNLQARDIERFNQEQKENCLKAIDLELNGIAMSMSVVTHTLNHLELTEAEQEDILQTLSKTFHDYGVQLVTADAEGG